LRSESISFFIQLFSVLKFFFRCIMNTNIILLLRVIKTTWQQWVKKDCKIVQSVFQHQSLFTLLDISFFSLIIFYSRLHTKDGRQPKVRNSMVKDMTRPEPKCDPLAYQNVFDDTQLLKTQLLSSDFGIYLRIIKFFL
jgi:hypothetical protein